MSSSAAKTQGCLPSDIRQIASRLKNEIPALEGKSFLLCGGGGFLGRYFTEVFHHLNQDVFLRPAKVVVLDNFISANKNYLNFKKSEHFKFLEHDITHPYEDGGHFDYILQAAGIASPYYYRKYPLKTLDVAMNGTRHMLDLAQKNDARVLFFSSSEIYGDPDPRFIPTPEDYNGNVSCLGPRACYDEGKRVGETLCRIYFETLGTKVKIVRPFNVYGPGMNQKDYRVLPNFASAILSDRPINIYGSGRQTRTFCYVTDALVGFIKTLVKGADGEPYNIGNPSPEITLLDLAKAIESVLGCTVKINFTPYPESYIAKEPVRRCPDLRKAETELGYKAEVGLSDGLGRFFQWARENYTLEAE